MRLTMQERKTVTKAFAQQYRRASKKGKGALLEQFVEATGYNRCYGSQLLRGHGKRVTFAPKVVVEGHVGVKGRRRGRKPYYGPEVVRALKKVWKIMDYICGKRLAAILPEVVPILVRHGELRVSRLVQKKLMQISAAAIDRLLAPERRKFAIKGRTRTKPGTLLKHQIPIRTFSDWNEQQPGFVELDLVAHDGGSSYGEYCQVLDVTDICTGWSEQFVVPTKAQCWVFDAIKTIRERLPFALRGIDSDNGGEFINHQLKDYCADELICFTRARSGRKNDNCYVEQKNWSIVRRFSGYGRYEGHEACQLLNELYLQVRDYVNFFMPSAKLIQKTRNGARVTKRYDTARTPYHRVLDSAHIDKSTKNQLRRYYATLNPAELKRRIERLQKELTTHNVRIHDTMVKTSKPAPNHPWRIHNTNTKKRINTL